RNVVATAAGLVGNKPIRLETDIPNTLPDLWADEARGRQVLLNLYSNAAQLTDHGTTMLRLHQVVGGVQARLTDSGAGIAPENLEVIFEEFKQAETGSRDPRSGAGLGLAISRQLMSLMGGRIWADSEIGTGSTFHFVVQSYHEPVDVAEPVMANES